MKRNTIKRKRINKKNRNTKRKGGNASLVVQYGNQTLSGQQLPRSRTIDTPSVSFSPMSGKHYTLIMWDPDVPATIQPGYLHWLVTNLESSSDISTHESIPYQGPNPPSGTHRYLFGLFEQRSDIRVTTIPRHKFDIQQFVSQYSLREISSVSMKVSANKTNV